MSETKILRDIQMLSRGDVRLFRNNTGKLQDRNGTWVAYGLCPGSSDLIGWRTTKITQDMVGSYVAIFVALEVKGPKGKPTAEQANFLCSVGAAGGKPGVVRSLQEACQVLNIDEKGTTLKP